MTQDNLQSIEEFVGRQLRDKRIKRGFTLATVAAEIGISYQQVQKYEQAQSKISAGILYKFAKLYDVGIEKFFEGFAQNHALLNNSSKNINQFPEKKTLNILIIEDNPGDEAVIRRALAQFDNINILCLHDGQQSMEFLRYKTLCNDFPRPDIIFLDIYIPKRNGIAILKEIKRDRDIQDIPVIVLTNNINSDLMASAYKNGASGYICKSFDFSLFKEHITNCIKYWSKSVILPSLLH